MNSSTITVGRQQTTISNQTIQKWRKKNCEIFDIFFNSPRPGWILNSWPKFVDVVVINFVIVFHQNQSFQIWSLNTSHYLNWVLNLNWRKNLQFKSYPYKPIKTDKKVYHFFYLFRVKVMVGFNQQQQF